MVKLVFMLVIISILVIFYFTQDIFIEMFYGGYQTFQSFVPMNGYKFPMYPLVNSNNWFYNFFPISNGYTNLPFLNTPLGNTTNMSYDLRGDPVEIPKTDFVWNNSSTIPIYNEPI